MNFINYCFPDFRPTKTEKTTKTINKATRDETKNQLAFNEKILQY